VTKVLLADKTRTGSVDDIYFGGNALEEAPVLNPPAIATSGGGTVRVWSNAGCVTENSGSSTGTGSQQAVAHGLAFTPTQQQVALIGGSATALPYHSAAPDAAYIYVTAASGQPWYWATVGGCLL
jgi:hypothetical protein